MIYDSRLVSLELLVLSWYSSQSGATITANLCVVHPGGKDVGDINVVRNADLLLGRWRIVSIRAKLARATDTGHSK